MRIKDITKEVKLEEAILMSMMASSNFLAKLRNSINQEYFTSSYGQEVCEWLFDYYDDHKKAPGQTLIKIFESKKDRFGREDANVIERLIHRMGELYDSEDDLDEEWIIKMSKPFFEKRELELKIEEATKLVNKGDIQEAKTVLDLSSALASVEVEPVSLTDSFVLETALSDEDDPVFSFDGGLGNVIGPLQKPWMVIFQAPMKRGKTQILCEMGFLAAVSGKKVYHVSMEMDTKASALRMMRRITGCCHIGGDYILPVFDCALNQSGECQSKHRPDQRPLIEENNKLPDFSTTEAILARNHIICNYCRNRPRLTQNYEPAVWYEVYNKETYRTKKNMKKIQVFEKLYGKNLKFVKYPKFSKTISEIFQEYHLYSLRTGFVADVMIIDYLDITKPLRNHTNSRDKFDETWKLAAGKADEFNVLLVSGAQGSRASIKKALMEEEDTTEDIRKLAHVDAMFSLNQTRGEKRKQVMRVGCLAHRHRDFDINKNAVLLQNIALGQVILDSEEMLVFESDFKEEN